MGTEITVFTVEKMQEIVDKSLVGAEVDTDDLVLHLHDGTTIDVGSIRGPKGDPGAQGDPGPPGDPGEGGGGASPWPEHVKYADYTLTLGDAFSYISVFAAVDAPKIITVPTEVDVPFENGTIIKFCQQAEGYFTMVGAEGVTLLSFGSSFSSVGQYAEFQLRKRSVDEWVLWGMLQTTPGG